MSVVIRMQRAGGRNWPFFRVVVADSRRARDGRFLEKVGFYNPVTQPAQVQLDQDRIRYWIGKGARPSESVSVLFKKYQPGIAGAAATPAVSVPSPVSTPQPAAPTAPAEAPASLPSEGPAEA